jgi:small subunit ribosomal protein S8
MVDPITDMLNRILNAQAVSHPTVDLPFSNLKYLILELLEKNGLVGKIEKKGRKTDKTITITLKYEDKEPVINGFKKISKPGQRIYCSWHE